MKLSQYDTTTWSDDSTNRTWQFGIIKNRALFCFLLDDDNPCPYYGVRINTTILSRTSLFSVDFQVRGYSLSFNFFSEYFEGWEE